MSFSIKNKMKKTHDENMFRVVFAPTGQVGDVADGSTIIEAARKAGITLTSICGGDGTCGKCRVIIEDGLVRQAPNPFISDGEIGKGQHPRLPLETPSRPAAR